MELLLENIRKCNSFTKSCGCPPCGWYCSQLWRARQIRWLLCSQGGGSVRIAFVCEYKYLPQIVSAKQCWSRVRRERPIRAVRLA